MAAMQAYEATGGFENTAYSMPEQEEAGTPYDATPREALEGTQPYPEEDVVMLRVHGGGAHTGVVPPGFEGMHSHVLDACPKARLTEEERLEREVARRRDADLERRARIFDAKRRHIGMDKDVIDQQCKENAERRQREAEAARAEDRQFMGINRQLQLVEAEKNAKRRQQEKAAKEYSMQNLHQASRREADINDKHAVRKGVTARIGDEDPRCGPASMQQFNGEDLLKEERKRQQQLANRDAVEQQIFEKKMLQMQDGADDRVYAQAVDEITQLRNSIEAEQAADRQGCMSGYREELLGNVQAKEERKRREAEEDQELNRRELDFHANGKLLNEEGGIRADGSKDKAGYKGSTREERVQVQEMQRAQGEDNDYRKHMEGHLDKQHHTSAEMTRRQLLMMEREKQRMKRAMAMEVSQHNQGMLSQSKEGITKDSHKNAISPQFFEQFGTGTR